MMVENVHFDLRWTTPFQLGFKLVSVNVSDIYAMGGRPSFMLLNLGAPVNMNVKCFNRLFDGIEEALRTYKLSLIGGDLSSSKKIVLSATVTGHAKKFITRKGAKAGDRIYVTGCLGDSSCGLELLKKIKKPVEIEKRSKNKHGLKWNFALPLVKRHLMPLARDPEKFIGKATSMIDISDGLIIDLSRLCKESRAGAKIYSDRLPISDELREASEYLGIPPLVFALGGGEDYELLFTAPASRKIDAVCIGEITRSGINILDKKGRKIKLGMKGYQHFV
ncbi:MAG: thiamine-phosphate kinase [Nitrospirae bacterium GWC2_42_7]|nr:MAG: thiamine-phosphate kinase [Nitrospirae bacterium GWC2_42_7]